MDRPDPHAPLLATADPHLAAEVARIAAGVGSTPVLVEDTGALLRAWHGPPLVMLGTDLVELVATVRPQRRAGVVLVSAGPVPPDLLRPALDLGVGEVAELPAARSWLTARLDDLGAGASEGRVIGVLGGAGGAGATTFAGALGQVGALRGTVLAVDTDPLGPGLDRVLGLEHVDGVGWETLASSHGRLSARDLREAVPRSGPLGVLTWRGGGVARLPGADQLLEVVDAARRGHDLVVLDVPRGGEHREALLARCDLQVVVSPTTIAGTAATLRACAGLDDPARAGLLLHGRDAECSGVARATGLPVLATMSPQKGLDESVDLGLGPVRNRRGPLGRAALAVLERVQLVGRAA